MFSAVNVIVFRGNFNRPSRRDDFSPHTLSQSAALSVIMGVMALLFAGPPLKHFEFWLIFLAFGSNII